MADKQHKSGAQQRKEKALRDAEDAQSDAARPFEEREEVEAPPKDMVGLMVWAQRVAARLLQETMNDRYISEPQRRRTCSDLIAKIGLTNSKAVAEERVLKLEKKLGTAKRQHDDDGLEPDPEAS